MVTLQTADNALKSYYLDAVSEALNMETNPFLAQIQKTSDNVVGKDVRKVVKIGVNGGVGAGSETGELPKSSPSDYLQLVATLKNIYGTIEISDKAIRASANNEGAFVNLLNDEMQSLIKSASFSFGRMLFGDGTGKIATVKSIVDEKTLLLDNVYGLAEGMMVDFYTARGEFNEDVSNVKIVAVDYSNDTIVLDVKDELSSDIMSAGSGVYLQKSYGLEITGLDAIFSDKIDSLYGVNKDHTLMKPYISEDAQYISEYAIQRVIDALEQNAGSKVNFIICSWGVRRAVVEHFRSNGFPLPTTEINGTMAYLFNGIPLVADRFCPKGVMYLLNTNDFKLHQLCDWQWLEGEDGKILKQIPGKPVYTATLVKYAELMCERPCGQGKITGIIEI